MKSNNQGTFHLLSIAFIPLNLVAWFLADRWYVGLLVTLASVVISYFLLFRNSI
jgi:hypothetical protein